MPAVEGRQCYVCGVGSDAVFRLNEVTGDDADLFFLRANRKHHPPLSSARQHHVTTTTTTTEAVYSRPLSCLGFQETEEFIRECPEGFQGCLTQIDGKYL